MCSTSDFIAICCPDKSSLIFLVYILVEQKWKKNPAGFFVHVCYWSFFIIVYEIEKKQPSNQKNPNPQGIEYMSIFNLWIFVLIDTIRCI